MKKEGEKNIVKKDKRGRYPLRATVAVLEGMMWLV
jgi:hypothetical protein